MAASVSRPAPFRIRLCRDAEWGRARTDWHTLTVGEAAAGLRTDAARGLAAAEAAARLLRHGPNEIARAARRPWWAMLAGQLRDFMVLVLMGAAAVSFLFREVADGAAILAIVAVNAVLGYLQEARAERSLEALRALTAPTARVVRQGRAGQVAAAELVPGDLVLLEAGDRVPADLRLAGAADLAADEAPLTGESQAVEKVARALAGAGLPPGDRRNMAYQGTHIVRGRGRGLVVATGGQTEVGRIAGLIGAAGDRETPLQRRLDQVGRTLVVACLLISATVVVLGVLQGEDPYRMFLAGVSLAVAAIPEGLPAIVTIALALGVQRMIRKHAIVRRLPAVETLGCATVICTDKTGAPVYPHGTGGRAAVPGRKPQRRGRSAPWIAADLPLLRRGPHGGRFIPAAVARTPHTAAADAAKGPGTPQFPGVPPLGPAVLSGWAAAGGAGAARWR